MAREHHSVRYLDSSRDSAWLDRAREEAPEGQAGSNLRYLGCRRPIRRALLVSFQCCCGSAIG